MKLSKWGCAVGLIFSLETGLPNVDMVRVTPSDEQRSEEVSFTTDQTKTQEELQILLEEKLRLIQLLQRFA